MKKRPNPLFPGWRVDPEHKFLAAYTVISVFATIGWLSWRVMVLEEQNLAPLPEPDTAPIDLEFTAPFDVFKWLQDNEQHTLFRGDTQRTLNMASIEKLRIQGDHKQYYQTEDFLVEWSNSAKKYLVCSLV